MNPRQDRFMELIVLKMRMIFFSLTLVRASVIDGRKQMDRAHSSYFKTTVAENIKFELLMIAILIPIAIFGCCAYLSSIFDDLMYTLKNNGK